MLATRDVGMVTKNVNFYLVFIECICLFILIILTLKKKQKQKKWKQPAAIEVKALFRLSGR